MGSNGAGWGGLTPTRAQMGPPRLHESGGHVPVNREELPDWPLGALELKVLELQRDVAFYEWFGLTRIAGAASRAVLGAGGAPRLGPTALGVGSPPPGRGRS